MQKWGQRKSHFCLLRGHFGGNAELMGGSFHSWCWESSYQSPFWLQHLLVAWLELLGAEYQCGIIVPQQTEGGMRPGRQSFLSRATWPIRA